MSAASLTDLLGVIKKHWGYDTLRPLQERAMLSVMEKRDSLTVLPTGGGKSLCYQAPAVLRGGTTIVVSPLISLMKDQVDGLLQCGIAATQIDSSMSAEERFVTELDLRHGQVNLLFVSPERLVMPEFRRILKDVKIHAIAIDEAHCISHWGHDFRPEYRQLDMLHSFFPGLSVHAYTATATAKVREDICKQLALKDPEVLVGDFDRHNLTYRVLPRQKMEKQISDLLDRHKGEAGIIYCLRRKDVDEVTAMLKQQGRDVLPYHAGMDAGYRAQVQEAFATEQCDLIVATVAFGMGIDRSNIRFVIHAAMPKSVEHYQQETGRAGRDGLEAECMLLHSGADRRTWEFILDKSFEENEANPQQLEIAKQHVRDMENYCRTAVCRHKALVSYFGQEYAKDNCKACDLCLGDTEMVPNALVVAQKILSCVARVKEKFGIGHVISVLRGDDNEKIARFGHKELSTYNLMPEFSAVELRNLIHQLISQEVLIFHDLTLNDGRIVQLLGLNDQSWEVMRGQRHVKLHQMVKKTKEQVRSSQTDKESWKGVDRVLFEKLRSLRREMAQERVVPPYVIFSDRTLRDLARVRPSSLAKMRQLYGIGEQKLNDFGDNFL